MANFWFCDVQKTESTALSEAHKKAISEGNRAAYRDGRKKCWRQGKSLLPAEKEALLKARKESFVHYEYNGKQYTLPDLAKLHGLNYSTVWGRMKKYGWTLEKALTA